MTPMPRQLYVERTSVLLTELTAVERIQYSTPHVQASEMSAVYARAFKLSDEIRPDIFGEARSAGATGSACHTLSSSRARKLTGEEGEAGQWSPPRACLSRLAPPLLYIRERAVDLGQGRGEILRYGFGERTGIMHGASQIGMCVLHISTSKNRRN